MSQTYHCPNCDSANVLLIENANRFYNLDYAEPHNHYYECGAATDEEVIDVNLICSNCNHIFSLKNLLVVEAEAEKRERRYEDFCTKEAAAAFCQGVEFVNDSAVTVDGPYKNEGGSWRVYIEDEDA